MVKVMGEGKVQSHEVSPTSYQFTSLSFRVNNRHLLFLWYGFFNIWPWESKAKIIAKGRIVGSTAYDRAELQVWTIP